MLPPRRVTGPRARLNNVILVLWVVVVLVSALKLHPILHTRLRAQKMIIRLKVVSLLSGLNVLKL